MRIYRLTAGQRAAIEAWNESRKNTLLIVCDHGDGNLGVDADALKDNPAFASYLTKLGEAYNASKVVVLTISEARMEA